MVISLSPRIYRQKYTRRASNKPRSDCKNASTSAIWAED